MSVRFVPLTVIFSGASAYPQAHATGTIGASSTTAGRKVRTFPTMLLFARLPKVIWIAPFSTVTLLT